MDIDWVTAILFILLSVCCVIPVAITIGGMIFSLLSDLSFYALNLPKDEEE